MSYQIPRSQANRSADTRTLAFIFLSPAPPIEHTLLTPLGDMVRFSTRTKSEWPLFEVRHLSIIK